EKLTCGGEPTPRLPAAVRGRERSWIRPHPGGSPRQAALSSVEPAVEAVAAPGQAPPPLAPTSPEDYGSRFLTAPALEGVVFTYLGRLLVEKFLQAAFSPDCHPGESAPLFPRLIDPPIGGTNSPQALPRLRMLGYDLCPGLMPH
ncbi:hypothetical protein P7K49_000299, partial [Saguinus oedipus]